MIIKFLRRWWRRRRYRAYLGQTLDRKSRIHRFLIQRGELIRIAAFGGFLLRYDLVSLRLFNTRSLPTYIPMFRHVGAGIGALGSGYLCDSVGRTSVITAGTAIMFVSVPLDVFPESLAVLVVFRLISGVGLGFLSVAVPIYLVEVAEANQRCRVVSMFFIYGLAGRFIAQLLNTLLAFAHGLGKYVDIIPQLMLMGLLLCYLVCLAYVPNSPAWLVACGKDEPAVYSLAALRSQGVINNPAVLGEFQEIRGGMEHEDIARQLSYRSLFGPQLLRVLGISVVMQSFRALYDNSMASDLDSHSLREYTPAVQAKIKAPTLVLRGISIVVAMAMRSWLDKHSRRGFLIGGALITGAAYVASGIVRLATGRPPGGFSVDPQSLYLARHDGAYFMQYFTDAVDILSFASSWGCIAWLYPIELFPVFIRAKAVSLGMCVYWLLGLVNKPLTSALYHDDSKLVMTLVYGILHVLFAAAVYMLFVETNPNSIARRRERDRKQQQKGLQRRRREKGKRGARVGGSPSPHSLVPHPPSDTSSQYHHSHSAVSIRVHRPPTPSPSMPTTTAPPIPAISVTSAPAPAIPAPPTPRPRPDSHAV
ncbi:MFS general substrate transporter [Martensiomyces pterosporus]|nr:MFS general substrate transporter [Martensiomyces pterosporus]